MATAAKKTAPAPARPAPSTSKAVAAPRNTAVATQDDVPDFIKKGKGRGNEAVEMADVVIPRIELVQALSPCLRRNDPAYIEGASAGALFNTVTRKLYGDKIDVVPVLFTKEYLCWRDRKAGGGFGGAYPSFEEAQNRINTEAKPEEWEVVEHAQQLVLVLEEDGATEEALISMSRTKMKVSKQWNSLIRLNGNDRFSRVYELFGVEEQNKNNDSYWNFAVANKGFVSKDIFDRAEKLYESVKSGARKVVYDTKGLDGGDDAPKGSGEY